MQRNWIGRSEGAHVDFDVDWPATGAGRDGLHHPPGHAVRRDVLRGRRRRHAGRRAGDRRAAAGASRPTWPRSARRPTSTGCPPTDPRPASSWAGHAVNPVNGERIPVWAADYVLADYGTGAIMAVPGARPARPGTSPGRSTCRSGASSTPADRTRRRRSSPPAGTAVTYVQLWLPLDGLTDKAAGIAPTVDQLEAEGRGQGRGQLPAARLAAVPPAVLGLPDPDRALSGVRRGRRTRRPAAGGAARSARRRPEAQGRLAAGGGRRVGQRRLPLVRRPGHAATPTRWTPSWTRRGTSCATARPHDHTRAVRRGRGAASGCRPRQLRRWRRARDPAPAVLALLHQGAERHGAGRLRRAVQRAAEPGAGDQPRQDDEQVAGQRRQPGGHDRRVRRGRGAADHGLRRPARGRHRLGRRVAGRVAAVPAARLAAGRRRHLDAGRRPAAGGDGACAGSPTGRCTTPSS